MSARWNSTDLARKPLPVPRKPPQRHTDTPPPNEAGRTQENPKCESLTLPRPTFGTLGGPCAWLFAGGTQSVALAGPHFGERHRVVWTGPTDEGAIAVVLAALEVYYATPKN
jgi:hypothetical protein